jgi:hypothetical protein
MYEQLINQEEEEVAVDGMTASFLYFNSFARNYHTNMPWIILTTGLILINLFMNHFVECFSHWIYTNYVNQCNIFSSTTCCV